MKRLFVSLFLLPALFIALGSIGYSEENEVKKVRQSFELLIKKMLDYGSKTVSEPYEVEGVFRMKKWLKNTDVAYDIKKTNSIISPYTATLKLRAESCVTEPASKPDDIKPDFKCNDNPKLPFVQKYLFAYQDGVWELKNAGFNIFFNPKGQDMNAGQASDSNIKMDGYNILSYIFNIVTIRKLQNDTSQDDQ